MPLSMYGLGHVARTTCYNARKEPMDVISGARKKRFDMAKST